MNDALQLLDKIQWIISPISDLVIFLFTTVLGRSILIAGFIIYIIATIIHTYRKRQLDILAASNYGPGEIPILEQIYLIFRDIVGSIIKLIANIPMLLAIFVLLLFIGGFGAGIDAIAEFSRNQQRISELSAVVRQLDQSYKVARIQVIDQNITAGTTTLKFEYFDYAKLDIPVTSQEITIPGFDIYIDALVLNFDYSEIVKGEKRNVALPYRVFSNAMPARDGIELLLKNNEGIPFIFNRPENKIYSLTPERYNERLKEIVSYMKDEALARQAGVRSIHGNAVHRIMKKGQTYEIRIEQTGGLVLVSAEEI